jgi:hypothetical protein
VYSEVRAPCSRAPRRGPSGRPHRGCPRTSGRGQGCFRRCTGGVH